MIAVKEKIDITRPEPTRAELGHPCLICGQMWATCKQNYRVEDKRCCKECRGAESH